MHYLIIIAVFTLLSWVIAGYGILKFFGII
jgi:hypothetical protein